jgi:pyridoxal phosphate enzyme (YggS family)
MTLSRDVVLANLGTIRAEMASAARRAARSPDSVRLVAAAKTVPAEAVAWVVEAGLTDVGENYVRELRSRRDDVPGARWHFIGTLQTSSAHHVAALADVVQTLSSERAGRRLARRAAEAGRILDALIEVDFTGERTGLAPEDVPAFADLIASLDGLRLAGLMTLPPLPATPEDARPWFVRLRELRDGLRDRHPEVVELSMGMSLDYPVAIEEGATMVRVGTALFGERTSPA